MKRKARIQQSSMENPGKAHSNRRLQSILDEEERLRVYAIRSAIVEKLTSIIGAVAVAWSTGVVMGAFGFLLGDFEYRLLSLVTFAEALRLFITGHELELQAISGEPRDSGVDFSTLPISKPQVLRVICMAIQILLALGRFGLSMWKLTSNHHFCKSNEDSNGFGFKTCQASVYVFYALTIVGAALFLLQRVFFEGFLIRLTRLDTKLDSLVFRKFVISVYAICLKGSILDGFHTNLVVLGVQWLGSDKVDVQLCGAKLLRGLISAGKLEKNDKQDSQTADALTKLGTYPGLLERLAEILSWNPDDRELVNEIVGIVRHVVASDRIVRSRFEAVPRALDAVETIVNGPADNIVGARPGESSADELDGQDLEEAPETFPQGLRYCSGSNNSTLERALHQYIADVVLIPDILRDIGNDDCTAVSM